MEIEEGKKRCRKCGEVKPLSEFYVRRGNRDGRSNKCKECAKRDQVCGTVFVVRRCIYCGADISRLHWKRTTCDAPECRERWEGELRLRRGRCKEAWLERGGKAKLGAEGSRGVRRCRVCGGVIRNGNRFFCEECFEVIQGADVRLDGAYIYCW